MIKRDYSLLMFNLYGLRLPNYCRFPSILVFRPQKVENVEFVDKTGMRDFLKNNVTSNLFDSHLIPLSSDENSKNRNEMMTRYEFHISYIKTAKQRKKCKE